MISQQNRGYWLSQGSGCSTATHLQVVKNILPCTCLHSLDIPCIVTNKKKCNNALFLVLVKRARYPYKIIPLVIILNLIH